MHEVFISYSHVDTAFAEVVRGRIRDAGFTAWIDQKELPAGEDWRREIDEAIRNSIALVVLVTPAAAASPQVGYEWAFALGAGAMVIPILLQPTELPPRLADLHHLDFTRCEAREWPRLIERLEGAAKARPTHAVAVPRSAPLIVRETVAALDDPDQTVMERAARRLADLDLPEATLALVGALSHPLFVVRRHVAYALARRGDVRALPGLIEAVRWSGRCLAPAAEATRSIGAPAAPKLVETLHDKDSWVRRFAVERLLELGDPAVVPEIITLLEDPDMEVRTAAVFALKRLSTPEALAALENTIPALARDLERDDDQGNRWKVRDALVCIDTENAWIALLASDVPSASEHAEALGKLLVGTSPQALAAVERALDRFAERDRKEGSWFVRGTLKDIGTERALALLTKYSRGKKPPVARHHKRSGRRSSGRTRD